jgi:hypothetical protein
MPAGKDCARFALPLRLAADGDVAVVEDQRTGEMPSARTNDDPDPPFTGSDSTTGFSLRRLHGGQRLG